MRRFGKWMGRILLVLVLAAVVVGLWKREEITRLLAVNSLFSKEKIITNFSNMKGAFLSTPVPRGMGPTAELNYGHDLVLTPEMEQWITDRNVTGLVVLKDGKIVHENYFLETTANDLRISWSVAKSYLSALFGVLLDEGVIASIDDPVVKYAPALADSAYKDASIRNVLNMASGVTFNEDYFDPKSDINRMGRVIALGGEMDDFTIGIKDSFVEPGAQWQYVSIDTHVISMVLRGATGRSIAELLSEKIIIPMGLEYEPYYIVDGVGTAFVLGGLNFTTRDYARFGQMYLQNGMYNGSQIVPADWVAASTVPSAPTAEGAIRYGYQWWIPVDAGPGEYLARGVYGQYIYINQPLGVVVAVNSADRKFREEGISDYNTAIFRMLATSAAQGG